MPRRFSNLAKLRAAARPRVPGGGTPARGRNRLNPDLTRQTRKVLGKHYRAKYGVK